MMRGARLRRMAGQASPTWGVVSQVLNSAGNMSVAVLVARATTPKEYGAWSIAYLAFVIATGLNRAAAATPILLTRSSVAPQRDVRGAIGLSLSIGVVSAALLMGTAAVVPGLAAHAAPVAAMLPLALPLDTARSVYFQRRHNRSAAGLDLLWLLVQLAASGALIGVGAHGSVPFTLAWGLAAGPPLVLAVARARILPRYRDTLSFLRRKRTDMGRLAAEQVLMSLRVQATPVVVAAAAGYAAAGNLRAGLTLMGGISALLLGLTPVGTVSMVRHLAEGAKGSALVARWTTAVAAIALVHGLALLAIPDSLGVKIMGSNWAGARSVMVPLVIHSLLRGPISGVPMMLRAQGRIDLALRLRVRAEPTALAFPVTGALLWGTTGAVWGFVAGGAVTALQSLLVMRRAEREPLPGREVLA